MLADLTEPASYVSWIRVVIILICLLPWLAFCQWVEKDTLYVRRINQSMWNGIVLGGGAAGLIVWLFMPWQSAGLFAAGFGLWFVITAGTCAVYVFVRNNVVDPTARVFTPKHIKGWFASLGKKPEQKAAASERVRLNGAKGKVKPPDDPAQAEPYEAAQQFLYDALWRRASEAELVLSASAFRLAYRIDGVVTPRDELFDRTHAEMALMFIKQVAGLDIAERRKPQAGSLGATISGNERGMTDIEVKSSGTTQHEKLSLKIVGQETRLRLGDLGLGEAMLERFESAGQTPGGLFLISGPPGSGVTTTLYAALRTHDAFMQNLLSLEREPLMELENITQNIFDADKPDSSYARQLQTVLRREPDVVLISDCMDRETAHLAVRAALEKRIYLGIEAKDSFDAVRKLVSLAGDTDTVAKVLRLVTSQRLIRKLCIACRMAYKPDAQLLAKANLPADKIEKFYRAPKPEEMVDEKGNPRVCPNCQNSFYYGRTGIFEMLAVDESIRDLVAKGQPVETIRNQARKAGTLYLQEVALAKVIEGTTSMNEVMRVLRDEPAKPGPSHG